MFSIRLEYNTLPSTPNPPTDYSPSLLVKDHSALEEHLRGIGVKLEDVNFFKWEALPARSYGKFLVSEREWLTVAKNSPNDGNPAELIAGDVFAELTISDGIDTKVFTNLDVVSTAFLMSPLAPTGVLGQDGSRLMVIELELSARKYHDYYRTYGFRGMWTGYGDVTTQDVTAYYVVSDQYNVHVMPDISILEYTAHLASLNFLTAYMPSGDIVQPWSLKPPKVTNQKFVFPTNKQMIYNKVSVAKGPIKFKVILPLDDWCKGTVYESEEVSAVEGTEVLYKSPMNSKTKQEEITVVLGYTNVDHLKVAFDSGYGYAEANRLANILKPRAQVRLFRNINVIYQGVVTGDISNDVQRITYRFGGNKIGLRTHLETIPWKVYNPILQPIKPHRDSTLFRGVLLSNMPNGVAALFSLKEPGVNGELGLQEYETIVKDKLGIFSNLKFGDKILVCRDGNSCDYFIVNGQCPSTPPTTPPPTGSCCVPVYPIFVSFADRGFLACYDGVPEYVCNNLGGTWTAGGTCPNPPICEEQQ